MMPPDTTLGILALALMFEGLKRQLTGHDGGTNMMLS